MFKCLKQIKHTRVISIDKLTEIYCIVDDFCIDFNNVKSGHVISNDSTKKSRSRISTLSYSKVITILITPST